MAKNLKFSRYLRKSKYTYSNQKLYSAKITIAAYSEDPHYNEEPERGSQCYNNGNKEVVQIRKRLVILKKNLR